MKKRLLITSIVMMLVCAVALSTATYAWFTSNTTVSASVVTLKAATSDKSALGIGWTGKEAGTFITSRINEILEPMAPEIKNWNGSAYVDGPLTDGLTTYEIAEHNQYFYTSNVKQEGSMIQFSNQAIRRNPVVYTEKAADATQDEMSSGKSNSFYIVNMSTANVLDKVIVSGVYTDQGTSGNYRYIIADTNREPDPNVTYYFKDNSPEGYSEVSGADYTFLTTHGFDNERTYYIQESRYVPTLHTHYKEDTNYFTRTGSGTDQSPYVYEPISNPTIGDEVAENTYELRDKNGDDMLRVAIFTKEYRYSTTETSQNGKSYFWIDPTDGILKAYTGTVTNPKNQKLLEIDTDAKHTLLGVIGKNATQFTAAATPFDMNTVYYVDGYEQATVTEDNFESLKDTLYKVSGSAFTSAASDTYNSDINYYTVTTEGTKSKVNSPVASEIGAYYTAKYTVVNGEIDVNKNVKDMYYYTNVKTSLDFALNLKPGEAVDIIAVIWLDGTDLDDTRSDEYAQVSLKFDSVRENHQSQNAHQGQN